MFKKAASLFLALSMMVCIMPIKSFADNFSLSDNEDVGSGLEQKSEELATQETAVLQQDKQSNSQENVNELEGEEEEPTSNWIEVAGIEGGKINFDESKGMIVECEQTVTVANIPATINGVQVTTIDYGAFSGCRQLTEVVVPEGVTKIDYGAFRFCYNLTKVILPESLVDMGKGEWYVNLSGTENFGVFTTCDKLVSAGPVGSGCNIEFAWKNEIPKDAFYCCDALEQVNIPEGITSIGSEAFQHCENLIEVTLPDTLEKIRIGAFYDTALYRDRSNWDDNGIFYLDRWLIMSDGKVEGEYSIRDGTIGIADYAFAYQYTGTISKLSMPDSVKYLGEGAFRENWALEKIILSPNIQRIEGETFDDVHSMKDWTIPEGITSIGPFAFANIEPDGDLIIPDSVSFIHKDAFFGTTLNGGIVIGDGLTEIPDIKIDSCRGDLIIGNGITEIPDDALWTSLDSYKDLFGGRLEIGQNVVAISPYAFKNCSFSNIRIPETTTNIGDGNFLNCSQVKTAGPVGSGCDYEFGWRQTIPQNAFSGLDGLVTLTVPEGIQKIEENVLVGCDSLQAIVLPASLKSIDSAWFGENVQIHPPTDIYFTGSLEEWTSIEHVGDTSWLDSVTVHYNSDENTLLPTNPTSNLSIRYLTEWDAENQIAYFADDTLHLGAAVTEETDTSFLANVDDMVGNYVIAGTRYRDDDMVGSDILLCMESVEAGTGSIQERTGESLTIHDTVYPLALKGEYPLFGADQGDQVLYGVQDGQIVALTALTTQTLHLDSWNPTTKTLKLSHELTEYTYTVSRLASEESLAILNADRDLTKSYSIEFACDTVSKIAYRIYRIYEEEYRHEFKLGKDNLGFANSPAYFLTDEEYEEWKKEYSSKQRFQTFFANAMGAWGIPAGIQISDDNINKLLRGQDNTVRERIQDALNKVWSGSCFGMSVVMANRFVAPGNLPIEKILPGNTSISNTFQLPAPSQSEDVENLINYYQLLYNYDYYCQKEKELADEVKTDYTAAVLKLINQIEDDDIPVLACIATPNVSSAHTVILLDVLETTADSYKVKVYDPNVTAAFTEMTIFRNKPSEDPDNLSKDLENSIRISYSSSSNSETATKQYTCLYNYLASAYEFDIQNYFDENSGYRVSLDDQQLTVLTVPVDTNVQMYAGNSVLNYKDGSVVERSEIYGAYPDVASLAEDGQTTELRFLLADTAEKYNLEVSPAESFASARLEMGTWAVYLSNDTDIVCEVDNTSKTVTVKTDSGEVGSLSAMIVTNDVTDAWPWYTVAIDTEDCSELSLSVEEDGVVITGDGLENSTVSVKDDNEVVKQAIATTSSEVKLVNKNEGFTVTNVQQNNKVTVDQLNLTNLITAPVRGATPQTELTTSQFAGTILWSDTPTVFAPETVYTATVKLTAAQNYTLEGLKADSFQYAGAEVHYDPMANQLTIVFPATDGRQVQSFAVTGTPSKTTYDLGEAFDVTGLTMTVTYDDGTTETVTSGYRIEPVNMAADTTQVVISYGGVKAEPVTGLTVRENLVSIQAPQAITELANGTEKTAEALGLPKTVKITTSRAQRAIAEADVTWDLNACSYDPAVKSEQTFVVQGLVSLPQRMTNLQNVPLTVAIEVTVKAAESKPTQPENPSDTEEKPVESNQPADNNATPVPTASSNAQPASDDTTQEEQNQTVAVPQTGDPMPITVLVVLMAVSFAGILALSIKRKKDQ